MEDMEIFRKLAQCQDKEQMQRCIEEYNEGRKVITNADRIRAMGDDELAYWVMCPYDDVNPEECKKGCMKCTLEWLQQPAKENNHA